MKRIVTDWRRADVIEICQTDRDINAFIVTLFCEVDVFNQAELESIQILWVIFK